MYKKHAKFRELDEARNEGNMDELASKSLQKANVQHSQHDESVSFQTVIQETSLKYSLYFVQILNSLPIELSPSLPNLPLPTSSSFNVTTDIPGPAAPQSEDHLPFDGAFDESDNNASNPDPGCLDLDASNEDSSASNTQVEDPLLLNLESIFKNTCLEDLLTAIKFIWALQSASHDDPHCKMDQNTIKWFRNPVTTPFDISSHPDLCIGLDLFLTNMNSSVKSFNANCDAVLQ